MKESSFYKSVSLILAAALMVLGPAQLAAARAVHATAGTTPIGEVRRHFSVNGDSTAVIFNLAPPNAATWWIPMDFDFPGGRTITVRGRVQQGGSLQCSAVSFTTAGALSSASQLVSFPVTANFTSISLTLSSAPAGAFGIIACQFSGLQRAELLGIDYSP